MNSQRFGLRVAAVLFAIFALGHLVRVFNQSRVLVGTHELPMWASMVAFVIAGALSWWMWRLSSAANR